MVCCGQHNLSMDFSLSARCLRIYYLPGHGGRITNGLGQALVARGYEVVGRESVSVTANHTEWANVGFVVIS